MPRHTSPAAAPGLPENIIPFPLNLETADFEAMDLNIDPVDQRKRWDAAFTAVQIALRFCQFDHVAAEASVRSMLESGSGIFDEMVDYHEQELAFLELAIMTMRCAGARMQLAYNRVQAKRVPTGGANV